MTHASRHTVWHMGCMAVMAAVATAIKLCTRRLMQPAEDDVPSKAGIEGSQPMLRCLQAAPVMYNMTRQHTMQLAFYPGSAAVPKPGCQQLECM